MSRTNLLAATVFLVVLAPTLSSQTGDRPSQSRSDLEKQIMDRQGDANARDVALARLNNEDEAKALELARGLLGDEPIFLRARAAWIVSDSGDKTGLRPLQEIAASPEPESALAIECLGRLRDVNARAFLRKELKDQTADSKVSDRGRTTALITALGDYCDPADGALLAQAVKKSYRVGAWDEVEALGKTGSRDAIPVLEETFARSAPGWATIMAGLGLARCGSATGAKYVSARLLDVSGNSSDRTQCCPADGLKDDPFGPKATDFILSRLGVPADERFLDDLTAIVKGSRYSERAKAHAWMALFRLATTREMPTIAELARGNARYEGAARLLVVTDENESRRRLEPRVGNDPIAGVQLLRALEATPKERKRWREIRGYTF